MGSICIYIVQLGSMLAPISTNLDRVGSPGPDIENREIGHFGGSPGGTNRSLSGVGHFDTSNFDRQNIRGQWALVLVTGRHTPLILLIVLDGDDGVSLHLLRDGRGDRGDSRDDDDDDDEADKRLVDEDEEDGSALVVAATAAIEWKIL